MSELHLACTGCDYTETFEPFGSGCYLLKEAGEDEYNTGGKGWLARDIETQHAWCNAEGHMVEAEKLPSIEELVAELHEVERRGEDLIDEITGLVLRPFAQQLWAARRTIAWRQERTAPERCLDCGSIDIIVAGDIQKRPSEFSHPRCDHDGRLFVRGITIMGICNRGGPAFGPDGLLLHNYEGDDWNTNEDAARERERREWRKRHATPTS